MGEVTMLLNQHIEFIDVKGVGHVDLRLSDKKMNVLIGSNGVGKTKTLESLYTLLLFTNRQIATRFTFPFSNSFVYSKALVNDISVISLSNDSYYGTIERVVYGDFYHDMPVIFLAAQGRGEIRHSINEGIRPLGEYRERQRQYIESTLSSIRDNFSMLNMNYPIEEWFIQRAQSANDYQDEEDNREVELLTVLRVLHQIDPRISANKKDFKIIGGKAVSIMLDGKSRRLNELSSGFASLIKIVQSIVAGYSFFTNTDNIEQTQGYILIDEIESHLHIEWQTKILPLLMQSFPNTYFVITTHSSLVLSQLVNGSAYQLLREDNKVITKPIPNAGQAALIDLLEEAFGVNLNKLRVNNTTAESQNEVKNALLDLLRKEYDK